MSGGRKATGCFLKGTMRLRADRIPGPIPRGGICRGPAAGTGDVRAVKISEAFFCVSRLAIVTWNHFFSGCSSHAFWLTEITDNSSAIREVRYLRESEGSTGNAMTLPCMPSRCSKPSIRYGTGGDCRATRPTAASSVREPYPFFRYKGAEKGDVRVPLHMLLHMERICNPEDHLRNPPFRPGEADLYEKDIVHGRQPSGILYVQPGGKMFDFVPEMTIPAGCFRTSAGHCHGPGSVAVYRTFFPSLPGKVVRAEFTCSGCTDVDACPVIFFPAVQGRTA